MSATYYEFPEAFRRQVAERRQQHRRLAYADVPMGLSIWVEEPGIVFLKYRYGAAPEEEVEITEIGRVSVGLGKFSRRVMVLRVNISDGKRSEVPGEIRRAFEALLVQSEREGPRMNYELASRGTKHVEGKIET